ncbi:MAG: ATP-dependent DNA helicase RecG [Clostridiales bacterium]|nr:ATP-dependent DNA helicase RecG [Clostridiales bacterium]
MMNSQPITSLKGIGDKTAALFAKLGVETVEDLLRDYPRTYDLYEETVPAGDLREGTVCAVSGRLVGKAGIRRYQHMQIITTTLQEMTGKVQLVWFGVPYIVSALPAGRVLTARGRVVRKSGRFVMEQPELYEVEDYAQIAGTLTPVYSQTKGLGNKAIIRAVEQALHNRGLEKEYLPESIRGRCELAEYNYAIEHIHFPATKKDLLFARKRLVFDEFFFFLLSVRRLKEKNENSRSRYRILPSEEADRLQAELPYELTGAQQKVWREIRTDLSGGRVMNRLIQGDVGSGKTMVAVLALLETVCSGYQGALMAPTEVLAKQHYITVTELFAKHQIGKKVVLVTGSMTAKEKRIAYEKIQSHEADIIIGTHALIQEKVQYDSLALVITDEQHRFGVGQREALGAKGEEPHVLVMSATPIPRTLAIILYGDLDISVIDEMPSHRLPVKNCVVDTGYRENAWRFIAGEVAKGRQAYVICPMVEESELIEAENVLDYTKLLRKKLPAGISVESLHGKMKPKDKNRVMERFASGEIQVLVSTTVVEVGVDVPNATVMMIENAERFGLAQLHQLRGRVGRGGYQSYCIMIDTGDNEETRARLEILNHSNDGFAIAAEDLKLRGPGDFFGLRQSGDMEFKLADIFSDAELLKLVSEEVNRLLDEDPGLEKEEHQALAARLKEYLDKSYEKVNL